MNQALSPSLIDTISEAVLAYDPDADIELLQRAYKYSSKVHTGQVRKSGEPYLIHPLMVAKLLTVAKLDIPSIVTGLLHDTVEDTLATIDEIEELFGKEIALLVDGVTKLSQIRFDTAEHKQAENFRKMLVAMAKDIRVILIKLCDRLHNMQTLEHLRPAKQRRIAQETMDIYAPLANRLGINWIKAELEDLSFRYLYEDEFLQTKSQVDKIATERHDYVDRVIGKINAELNKAKVLGDVSGRPKHLYSIHKKMATSGVSYDQIYDVIAFRVEVATIGHCYEVLGMVHTLWPPIPGRFKDYIAMPKANGYRSLHTSVICIEGERIEIQIRTHDMHKVAEEGIAAHWAYKEGGGGPDADQFAWLRQLLEWQQDLDDPNDFMDAVKYDLFTDEVFVFTPRGEVISLKRGATPIDFAYTIHSEVGNKCAGAKINGRMVPLRYKLRDGDMVEIITHPRQRPSKDWLSFVGTSRARTKIRNVVRYDERMLALELGREMLERDLKKNGQSLQQILKKGPLQKIAEASRHRTLDNLFIAIGYGRTTSSQVVSKLSDSSQSLPAVTAVPPVPMIEMRSTATTRRASGGVIVQGLDDVLVRYGKCCNPLVGEEIIGFVTRGRGITVHRQSCSRATDVDPERRIDVSWDRHRDIHRPVEIRVETYDQPGILATISGVFSDSGVNIAQANCRVEGSGEAINTFEVMVKDSEQLRFVLGKIRQLSGVIAVIRA